MKRTLQLLGNRIRALREERELTRAEVASVLGITVDMYMRIELGYKPTSVENLINIAHVLRVDVVFLWVFPEINLMHEMLDMPRDAPRAKVQAMHESCSAIMARRVTKPAANQ